MAITLKKTGDQRLAYVIDNIERLGIRFPVGEISKKTGVSKSQVSETLSGKIALSDNFFKTFCKAYNLTGLEKPALPGDEFNRERALIKVLLNEVAKLQSKVYKRSLHDCLEELEQNTTIVINDLEKS